MVTSMIFIGGYTRLSGSGLSMTTWNLAGRSLPKGEDWLKEFEQYKQFPEYKKMYDGRMTIDEFKRIYFVEWFHRMLGRATGAVFLLPLSGFLVAGALRKPLLYRLGALGSLGLTQGLIGWWMVRSGLNPELLDASKPPRVSSYRMCFHWLMALGLYGGCSWLAMSLLLKRPTAMPRGVLERIRKASLFPLSFAAVTLTSGPFVAGNDAGRAFNSWPKMGDVWVPEEVKDFGRQVISGVEIGNSSDAAYRRIFEDTAIVQFTHRCLAYGTVLSSLGFGWFSSRLVPRGSILSMAVRAVPLVAIAQMTLGITTLLMYVPLELGLAHQAGGLAVFSSLLLVRYLTG